MASGRASITIGGHEISVSHPDRVIYPAAGFTKADVIAYYVDVADALLPVLADRTVTRRRWVAGVEGEGFFEKNAPDGMPEWVPTITLMHAEGPVTYPLVRDRATLAWLGQVSALELHVPQWRLDPPIEDEPGAKGRAKARRTRDLNNVLTVETIGRRTDRLIIDLDPGPPAGLTEAAQVALALRPILAEFGLPSIPVTSGSKGIHIYARLDADLPGGVSTSEFAKALGKRLGDELGDLVLTDMTRKIREGKVLLDWSQNNPFKTTIAPYSLRGRSTPMVATPRTWDEIEDPDLRHLDVDDVRARLAGGIEPFATVFGGTMAGTGS